jgi:predicted RND superfamily exporter protein
MTKFILAAFRFFKEHKAAFYIVLISSFILFAFFGAKMHYEEDISKLLPSAGNNNGARYAFDKLRVKDKIFLEFVPRGTQISNSGSTKENAGAEGVTPDSLILCADTFCDSLIAHNGGEIENVLWKIDDTLVQNAVSFIFENAPVFLPADFYPRFDRMLQPAVLDSLMAANTELLSSPEGSAYYDIIREDPLALRNLFSAKSASSGSVSNGSAPAAGNSGNPLKDSDYKIISNHFFSPDSTMALAFLSPSFKSFDSKSGTRLVNNLQKEIASFEAANPGVEVLFYGSPVQSVFNSKRIKKDLTITVSISLLLICLIIGFSFRKTIGGFKVLVLLLLPLIYGIVFALAMMYFIQGSMSFISLGIGSLVIGVALSYCLHVITHYSYLYDPERVIKEQTKPVMLGCITTIGALMGLMFTRSSLLRDFGLFASLVMLGTTLSALLFLPQFFKTKAPKTMNGEGNNNNDNDSDNDNDNGELVSSDNKAFRVIERITSYPYHKKSWLIALVLLVFSASLIITGGKAKFDTDITHLGYYEPKVVRANNLYTEKVMHGLTQKYYAVFAGSLDSALRYNQKIGYICRDLKQRGEIAKYSNSSALLLPEDEQNARINFWNNYWTPDRKQEVKSLIIRAGEKAGFEADMFSPFYEMVEKQYKPVSLYDSNVLPNSLMSNMIEHTGDTWLVFTAVKAPAENFKKISKFIARGGVYGKPESVSSGNAAAAENELAKHTLVVDPFFYTSDMVSIMSHDFNLVLMISSIFVLIVLLLSMRNVVYALIAFLPMGMSWYIVLGAMAAAGVEFNLINIIISTFIFGMGVDYSIFVMDGLTHENRVSGRDMSGASGKELLVYHKSAIFFSACILIIAVVSLMFAVHPAISSIGFSTLVGMISTIMITFVLQPWLFEAYEKVRAKVKK